MDQRYYTIGLAGHIDHGKTALTKALTQVDTDRLKEEKERQISIELGYAPFILEPYQTSIIDVPGHEKFIRQMIAGSAGIDMAILVVAADEGTMPQTKEHLEILSYLDIRHGLIAVTKCDKVEDVFLSMVADDIRAAVKGTFLEQENIIFVDSISGRGIGQLKAAIREKLAQIPKRNESGEFRLPIDQVFALQGHGTIVRGTIFEGAVHSGQHLLLLPQNKTVKAKQIQVHFQFRKEAAAGQRAAINLGGIHKSEVKRGDVLVSSPHVTVSDTVDIFLQISQHFHFPLKQRSTVKFHSGTSEVTGKIVFFDRNEARDGENVLCQLRLEQPVAVKRGDRFVVRRPSPPATIGGGRVINPLGEKYRFGEKTVEKLKQMMEGSPKEQILDLLYERRILSKNELSQWTSAAGKELEAMLSELMQAGKVLEQEPKHYAHAEIVMQAGQKIRERLQQFHQARPSRVGMNKAECIQAVSAREPVKLAETVLEREIRKGTILQKKHYLFLPGFQPHIPSQLQERVADMLKRWEEDELNAAHIEDYFQKAHIPQKDIEDLTHYLIETELIYPLNEKCYIHRDVFNKFASLLYRKTGDSEFTIHEAKNLIPASRSRLVQFLELLDRLGFTKREQDKRKWLRAWSP
jgi:selenocysteine-specific elongation factor